MARAGAGGCEDNSAMSGTRRGMTPRMRGNGSAASTDDFAARSAGDSGRDGAGATPMERRTAAGDSIAVGGSRSGSYAAKEAAAKPMGAGPNPNSPKPSAITVTEQAPKTIPRTVRSGAENRRKTMGEEVLE